jgi:uncharacterized membrane protein
MIPDADGKPESRQSQAEEMARLLEIELMQNRAAWQSANERSRKIRTASYVFLLFITLAALFAFYILITQVNERRSTHPTPEPSASVRR